MIERNAACNVRPNVLRYRLPQIGSLLLRHGRKLSLIPWPTQQHFYLLLGG